MPQANPFTVTIYSKDLAFQQVLGSALSYSFTPRWTLATGALITRADDPSNQLLGQEGARVVVEYRGEVLMSGWVFQQTGPVLAAGTVAWDVYDDRYALAWTRAWVVPSGGLAAASLTDTAQQVPPSAGHIAGRADGSGYYPWPSNPTIYPAETAVKKVIGDNLARFGSGVLQGKIVIQPDQGRGGDARAAGMLPQLRFDSLQDGLADLLEWAGLGVRVWQAPGATTVKLDVFAPTTWSQVITSDSAIVTDGQYQRTGPTATRPVIGGPGEDAARVFYSGPTATDLEARFGVAIETFTDATGATLVWPDSLAENMQVAAYYLQRSEVAASDKAALVSYLTQAAAGALTDGLPTSGLNVTLSETASFHYGGSDGYHVGDLITIGTATGPTITERITEATLTYSGDGFSVNPTVGTIEQDPTAQLAKVVGALAQALSGLQSRK